MKDKLKTVICNNCNTKYKVKISEKTKKYSCKKCHNIIIVEGEETHCQYCNNKLNKSSKYCDNCGKPVNISSEKLNKFSTLDFNSQNVVYDYKKDLNNKNSRFEIKTNTQNSRKNKITCPNCGSDQITANKKGFGIGKSVAGLALFLLGLRQVLLA